MRNFFFIPFFLLFVVLPLSFAAIPSSPTSIKADPIHGSYITATWVAGAASTYTAVLLDSTVKGNFTSETTSVVIDGLTPGTAYTLYAYSYNSTGFRNNTAASDSFTTSHSDISDGMYGTSGLGSQIGGFLDNTKGSIASFVFYFVLIGAIVGIIGAIIFALRDKFGGSFG